MQDLIFIILLNLGVSTQPGNHYSLSPNLVNQIHDSALYKQFGNDIEFSKCVTVLDNSKDDIVITDDDNPIEDTEN